MRKLKIQIDFCSIYWNHSGVSLTLLFGATVRLQGGQGAWIQAAFVDNASLLQGQQRVLDLVGQFVEIAASWKT